MIDDTRDLGPSKVEFSGSISAEIVAISKHRTDRNAALHWARNLRFLASEDGLENKAHEKSMKECAVCYNARKIRFFGQQDFVDPTLFHVCDKPFENNHKITAKEFQIHPMRFKCDICTRGIWSGSRNHCNECLSGDFDICDACALSGKHCLSAEHVLEKIPIFKYGDCVHVNERSCGDCKNVPLFPNEGEVTNFQIVQLQNATDIEETFSNCDHFVAVSYCWPPPQYDGEGNFIQHKGEYSVKDLNGNVRPNRAPEDVITRAVRFAAQNGIRFIWIDQECIDQEDPEDKELGIQVMDKVYQRAFLSIGLLRTRIESQDSLRAIKHFLLNSENPQGFNTANVPPEELMESFTAFFGLIMNDPWHTRAWILQEAFSAGPRMVLLLQHAPEISTEGLPCISETLSVSEIVLHLDQFIVMIDYANWFLTKSPTSLPTTHDLTQKRFAILREFRKFPPGDMRSMESKWAHRAGSARPRRTCNAAVALSYLRTRDNTHVPDRLAILANLCNYEIRLNTIEVERNHHYLGYCVLSLALINGDFSLLYPEVYRDLRTAEDVLQLDSDDTPLNMAAVIDTGRTDFSWLRMTSKDFRLLDARSLNPYAYYLPNISESTKVTTSGLLIPGYLWKVDQKIYLAEFAEERMKLAKTAWFRTRHTNFTIHVLRSPSYTSESWKRIWTKSPVIHDLDVEQKAIIHAGLNRANEMTPEKYEAFLENYRLHILKQVPEGLEATFYSEMVTWLLRTLYMLRQQDELEVADAIWNSVRADIWDVSLNPIQNRAKGSFSLVADFPPLNDEGNIPINTHIAVDMFALDWDRDGGLQQCWIIDNLFRDGYLSVGKFVRISTHDKFEYHSDWYDDRQEASADAFDTADIQTTMASLNVREETSHGSGHVIPESTAQVSGDRTNTLIGTDTTTAEKSELTFQTSQYADTQLFKQLMSNFISLVSDLPASTTLSELVSTTRQGNIISTKTRENLLGAAMLYGRMVTDWDASNISKLQNMRAVFDIKWGNKEEEVQWVLTPYDPRTERLPHAEARSMSMSWLVEPTGDCPDWKDNIMEVFKTIRTVKGLWKFLDIPFTQYLVV
ncbi:hypothetical protein VTL71DRAFT_16173 [Oculimacula yallundae]|uniref:ZZ-type domain-containing protein n=1 Tax=Oculimacula yallundae TaxID=86028 RepID=A0ABR4CDQ5_9HELO